jgi:hypothetical protein
MLFSQDYLVVSLTFRKNGGELGDSHYQTAGERRQGSQGTARLELKPKNILKTFHFFPCLFPLFWIWNLIGKVE